MNGCGGHSRVKAAFGESTPTPNAQGNLPEPSLTEIMFDEITKDKHPLKDTKGGAPQRIPLITILGAAASRTNDFHSTSKFATS